MLRTLVRRMAWIAAYPLSTALMRVVIGTGALLLFFWLVGRTFHHGGD